ncbi:hypothetical protein EYF80_005423 [Liparis tanakae]|uniref:Uncharacterized protein n=1 Tax=Liparis tanakae TaxID=230148 RepID=A0A4Z2J2J8_9TELE|nr:hypothetical protein EYF80_005423 [Liparis tanakae]
MTPRLQRQTQIRETSQSLALRGIDSLSVDPVHHPWESYLLFKEEPTQQTTCRAPLPYTTNPAWPRGHALKEDSDGLGTGPRRGTRPPSHQSYKYASLVLLGPRLKSCPTSSSSSALINLYRLSQTKPPGVVGHTGAPMCSIGRLRSSCGPSRDAISSVTTPTASDLHALQPLDVFSPAASELPHHP